ncbi:MAG: DUF6516 family protein [Rhodospirillaceae bacterium]|nr:DUF6516 family protein [Rhodospirillaceae bacterium]
MKAELLIDVRIALAEDRFAEITIWKLPKPVAASRHFYKYRLAYVVDEICAVRFDNEAGKGDHKHVDEVESPYRFTTPETLVDDFWDVIKARREG